MTEERYAMDPFEKLKNKKTLLVDDDGLIRESLSMAFLGRGCAITAVESAEKGIEILALEHFDIIISDFKLSGMNGMDFFKVTGESLAGSIKVLISGNIGADEIDATDRLGIHQFIEKPFTVMSLAGALAGLIDNRENVSSSH